MAVCVSSPTRHRHDERYQAILDTLAQIPQGYVCTYGEIAKRAGFKGQARYVGFVLKHLPEDSSIPWHRVINAAGRVSFPIDSDKYREQIRRLRGEGVPIRNGKIKLNTHMW